MQRKMGGAPEDDRWAAKGEAGTQKAGVLHSAQGSAMASSVVGFKVGCTCPWGEKCSRVP
jgi:hypothetical protein